MAEKGRERARLETDFILAMRRTGSIMQLLGQTAADRIGINPTDLNCLNIVALTGPMTAGDLAKATGLTTASITGVLDRLEDSGLVRRERDTSDRRRVLVHMEPRAGRDVAPVFGPIVHGWRDAAAGYTDEQLELFLDLQHRLEDVLRETLAKIRSSGS
jgi:DNA-binding MarR family transcriptional regulator